MSKQKPHRNGADDWSGIEPDSFDYTRGALALVVPYHHGYEVTASAAASDRNQIALLDRMGVRKPSYLTWGVQRVKPVKISHL